LGTSASKGHVHSLPMRNGNTNYWVKTGKAGPVHSLPMRNGNGFRRFRRWGLQSSTAYLWGMETNSGLTIRVQKSLGPQPTYEEWKQVQKSLLPGISLCPQPTYEEWKLYNMQVFGAGIAVHSLPMRNGNKHRLSLGIIQQPSTAYLWGMETYIIRLVRPACAWSTAYLWGMETHKPFALRLE